MSQDHSVWAGLGARGDVAPAGGSDEAGNDPFDRDPVQRTVAAASAPPLQLDPSKSPFTSWRRPGSAAPSGGRDEETAATTNDDEEASTMGRQKPTEKKARKPRAANASNPQFQICTVLLAGDRTREELLQDVSATRSAFNGGLFNAKSAQRVEFIEKTAKYHLTSLGRDWVTGAAIPAKPKGGGKAQVSAPSATSQRTASKPAKPGKAAAATPAAAAGAVTVVDTSPQVLTPPSFRCAVISDGGFWITKNGVEIELTLDEHRQMVRYQERMAEPA